MESDRKPQMRDRITGFFKKLRGQEVSESATHRVHSEPPVPKAEVYGDRERTRERYKDAAKLLEEVVKGRGSEWGGFDFPELQGEPEGFDDVKFKDKLDTVLQTRKDGLKDRSALKKCGDLVQRMFTASAPFAKNFLSIARQAQSVPAHSMISHDSRFLFSILTDCFVEVFCC
jgi:hypothetical protein